MLRTTTSQVKTGDIVSMIATMEKFVTTTSKDNFDIVITEMFGTTTSKDS